MLQLHAFCFNPFSENTYVLSNEENQCWIIDPGMYDEPEREAFTRFLDSSRLQPLGIINTHAHIDHIFGVQWLMDTFQIPFALHPLEGPVLAGAKTSALMFGLAFHESPKPSQVIRAGQDLFLGTDKLQVRHTPGHSPGSVVFYNKQAGWLLGGDVLFAGSIGRTDLPGGNHEQLLQSIRSQLFSLPQETRVFPGHGPETSIGEEMQYNPFLRP